MEILEVMKERHSVRQYETKSIEDGKRRKINDAIEKANKEGGLNIQVFYDEPKCFDSMMAHYGKFSGVENYICLVGPKADDLEEKLGYYGEQIVLLAQEIGLNTCWVAMTHGKSAAKIGSGEKQCCLIALGYGKNQGFSHKVKSYDEVTENAADAPEWFKQGVEAALLAPTATNQQKFVFGLNGEEPYAKVSGFGFYSKMDLGIVKYHFEAVTGKKVK